VSPVCLASLLVVAVMKSDGCLCSLFLRGRGRMKNMTRTVAMLSTPVQETCSSVQELCSMLGWSVFCYLMIIIITVIIPQQFLWCCHDDQSHFESLPGSFDVGMLTRLLDKRL